MRSPRFEPRRLLPALAIGLAALGSMAGLAWSLWHCVHADLGSVELGYWYEASRFRRGLQAFVDPSKGVSDDGPVPIVSLQTYTPFFGYFLSRLPEEWTTLAGRLLSTAAWFGGMLGFALTGKPGQRRGAVLYALCYAPLFFLLRSGASLTPDALAAGMASLGLALVLRRGRVTLPAVLWMSAGGLLKANVIGVFLGVLACDLLRKQGRAWLAWLASGAVVLAALGGIQWMSHGVWFLAFQATTQNAISIYRYWHYICEYSVFLGGPQLVVAWLAYRADRSNRAPSYGASALVASVAWQFIATGRYGATSNYWLEPVMAACVVIGHGSRRSLPDWTNLLSPLAPLLLIAVSIVPARDATLSTRDLEDGPLVARIGRSCENDGKRSWFGIDRLELRATGRIAVYSFGAAFRGERLLAPMRALLENPAVSCFVHGRDLGVPFVSNDPATEMPVYDFYLRDTVLAGYDLVDQADGVYVYRHRTH